MDASRSRDFSDQKLKANQKSAPTRDERHNERVSTRGSPHGQGLLVEARFPWTDIAGSIGNCVTTDLIPADRSDNDNDNDNDLAKQSLADDDSNLRLQLFPGKAASRDDPTGLNRSSSRKMYKSQAHTAESAKNASSFDNNLGQCQKGQRRVYFGCNFA